MKHINLFKCILLTIIGLFETIYSMAQIPTLEWVKGVTSDTRWAETTSIKTDASGNVVIAGYFQGTVDMDPGPAVLNLTYPTGSAFISKFTAKGNLIWVKNFLATGISEMAIDANGDIICTGAFEGTVDFDPGPSFSNLKSTKLMDIYLLKLDSAGNFKWAKSFGGKEYDGTLNIAFDAACNIYVEGYFNGTVDFDPGTGVFTMSDVGIELYKYQLFIAKYDAVGNFVWARKTGVANISLSMFYLDYTSGYRGSDLVADASGNVYAVGRFNQTQDFDPGTGEFKLSANYMDAYITKYNTSGNFIWAKQLGAKYLAIPSAIVADTLGNLFFTGVFYDTLQFDPAWLLPNLVSHSGSDIFICKMDTSGDMIWARNIGNSEYNNFGQSISLDISGNVYVSGGFIGTMDFDPAAGTKYITAPDTQLFISKFTPTGNFQWVKHIEVYSRKNWYQHQPIHIITVDKLGSIYTTGYFYGTVDFDPDAGKVNLSSPTSYGFYVHKMSYGNTGVNEVVESKLKYFPNPATTSINIDLSNSTQHYDRLEIINSCGQICINQPLDASNQSFNLNIEQLHPGLYLIKISNGNSCNFSKFIKQ